MHFVFSFCWGTCTHADTNQGKVQLHQVTWHTSLFSPSQGSKLGCKFLGITFGVYTKWSMHTLNSVSCPLLPLLAGHVKPLSLSSSWEHSSCGPLLGLPVQSAAGFILFCLKGAELSWTPTLRGCFFSRELVLTFGIIYWKDFNGFLTPTVACENSILQAHCYIYSYVHTFLWFWEETQKGLSLYPPPPSLHASLPSVLRTPTDHSWG